MSARTTELNQHQNNTLEVFSSFYELMKPRVMSLVIFTALVVLVIAPTKINFVNSLFSLLFVCKCSKRTQTKEKITVPKD